MKQHSPQFLKIVEDAKSRVREIPVPQVLAKIKKAERFHFVDVREDSEWDSGHAKGAVHIGRGVLERDIEKAIPDPQSPIVLYCGGGFRSALAADNLQRMGYKNVRSMAGGWTAWCEAGGTVESS